MNLKTNILKGNKRGSYLVEAAIIMPILIISVCSLILVIRIVAICENITYITSTNLIDTMFFYDNKLNIFTLCGDIEDGSPSFSNFKVKKLKYLYDDGNMDKLIALDAEAKFHVFNVIGIDGNIIFEEKILCRAFAGAKQPLRPLSKKTLLKEQGP